MIGRTSAFSARVCRSAASHSALQADGRAKRYTPLANSFCSLTENEDSTRYFGALGGDRRGMRYTPRDLNFCLNVKCSLERTLYGLVGSGGQAGRQLWEAGRQQRK